MATNSAFQTARIELGARASLKRLNFFAGPRKISRPAGYRQHAGATRHSIQQAGAHRRSFGISPEYVVHATARVTLVTPAATAVSHG
jgi:hypothetical protein